MRNRNMWTLHEQSEKMAVGTDLLGDITSAVKLLKVKPVSFPVFKRYNTKVWGGKT
jgi:hypothetical protein